MATSIIIGSATTVSFGGECALSAQWGFNPNAQRLYCIGSWDPHATYYRPTETLNITIYAPGPTYSTAPSNSCTNANTIAASVTPIGCGSSVEGVSGSWYVTGYNYTKQEKGMPGQESWSLTKWVAGSVANSIAPTYVIRGIAEGQTTDEGSTGITFSSTDGLDATSGSVSANAVGTAETNVFGVVEQVGGGSSAVGDIGQGSANIPYTPLYV